MDTKPKKRKRTPRKPEHYINNAEFSDAVAEYVRMCKNNPEEEYPVTEQIGTYFLKLCSGLSYSPNFAKYTYREDMVMDAVENCLKAIKNFDIDKPTRTGKPNPFSYFTQIAYFAFLRRIQREKKQTEIREKLITQGSIDSFVYTSQTDSHSGGVINRVLNRMETDRRLNTSSKPKAYKKRAPKKTSTANLEEL